MSGNNLFPSIERITALCYIRQSFTRNADDMNSPDRQRANIQAYCDRHGWIPEWYQDTEGHKSGRYVNNRPGFLALEERLQDTDVVALVANDLSRIHRKTWRVGKLVETLDEYGVRLVLAAPGREIDTSTQVGRMMITVLALQDEAYATDISQRVKDSIEYRKSQGKSVGMPPFGTIRDDDGYLQPASTGAWLLGDGRHVSGEDSEQAPEDTALWRGYYACAQRILELYAENKMGIERIAYQITSEGWAFRDRRNQPRLVNRDDIRRVVSSWREYAGLNADGRGKDKNASMIDNPLEVLHDTGRSVFPFELIQAVASVQKMRSVTQRPFGSVKAAHPYPLTRLLFCAHCEDKAEEQKNPSFRSRLSGVDQYGKLRYRHAEGVKCGCKTRSVAKDTVESEFRLLLELLSIKNEALPLLLELDVQSKEGWAASSDAKAEEKQKQQAIARLHRQLEAARTVFLDGDMPRDEYLKRKEKLEREIAHWQARTSETEKAALELRMCMQAVNQMVKIWDSGNDEDRQEMARMVFEYIVYDLDLQRIVDFRLKPWADHFLVLRAELHEKEDNDNGDDSGADDAEIKNRSSLKQMSDLCPIGDSNPCFSLERATS